MVKKSSKKLPTDPKDSDPSETVRLINELDRRFSEIFGGGAGDTFFADMLMPKEPPRRDAPGAQPWRPTVVAGAQAARGAGMVAARTAALEVDAQQGLVRGGGPTAEAAEIVAQLNAQARLCGVRIAAKHGGEAAAADGLQSIDGLPPLSDYDYCVWRGVEPGLNPRGACYHDRAERISTGIIEYLRACDVDTVLVGGISLQDNVKHTVLQLLRAGFRVVVNLGAVPGLAAEGEAAIEVMCGAGAELVASAAELEPLA